MTTPVDLSTFDLFDPEIQHCPHPHYAAMRDRGPVFEADMGGLPVYLVVGHEAVLSALKDHETFSSAFGATSVPSGRELSVRLKALREELGGYPPVNTMLTADPPEQTRYRLLVSKAFTPKAIADLEPTIRSIAAGLTTDLLAAAEGGSAVDFIPAFAVPLPVTVIARALNVPDDHLADFKRWSDEATASIGTAISDDRRVEAERASIEFQHYFADQLEQRRAEPRDDILTNLLNARIDDGDGLDASHDARPLDMPEMLSILQQLLVAGNQTTTKMLAEMMRLFGEHPDRWQAVRDDPALVNACVEEVLRLSTPTQGMWRKATRDITIDGTTIPAGGVVVVMFTSANRDGAVFDDPDGFDPGRDGLANHLAFGKGAHYCLGANLARMEARIALEELARRIPAFSLSARNSFDYLPSFMLRGLTELHLEIP
jgi:cytochrome P450